MNRLEFQHLWFEVENLQLLAKRRLPASHPVNLALAAALDEHEGEMPAAEALLAAKDAVYSMNPLQLSILLAGWKPQPSRETPGAILHSLAALNDSAVRVLEIVAPIPPELPNTIHYQSFEIRDDRIPVRVTVLEGTSLSDAMTGLHKVMEAMQREWWLMINGTAAVEDHDDDQPPRKQRKKKGDSVSTPSVPALGGRRNSRAVEPAVAC